MKKLLWLIVPILLIVSCKKDKTTEAEKNYPQLIKGKWELDKTVIYYTPTGQSGTATDVDEAEDNDYYYTFTNNEVIVTLNGDNTPFLNFNYTLSGRLLILTNTANTDVFEGEIEKLNNKDLTIKHHEGAGDLLYDDDELLGTIQYAKIYMERD